MNEEAKIYGFAILRNGVRYDYPFIECLKSMEDVCINTYLALGKSDDGTENKLSNFKNLKIKNTIWDDNLRKGGLILSQQTNIALDFLRSDHAEKNNAWGFYLQCDEVIHERDYDLLREDFNKAQEEGHDSISFRYLHFWQSHKKVAINKKWYPQEIRAVKLNSKAKSWGDAQSFLDVENTYQSEVIIYHYGHVREEEKYRNKKADILKFYHSDEKMKKYKRREKRYDSMTECVSFLGTHPLVMKERITDFGENWEENKVDHAYIIGSKDDISESVKKRILANNIYFVKSVFEVPICHRNFMVILRPNFFQKIWYGIKTPLQMRSKLSIPWREDFRFELMFYEKGISLK